MRLETAVEKAHKDESYPPTFTAEWIEDNVSEEKINDIFWMTCESEYEYFTEWCREIDPNVRFDVEGRQGGWAVSNYTEQDVEYWDAIDLGRWRKMCKIAKDIAAHIHVQVVHSIAINEYSPDNLFVDAAPVGETLANIS
jgi:hypothetical protein